MEATWRVQQRGGGSRQHVGNGPIILHGHVHTGMAEQLLHGDEIDVGSEQSVGDGALRGVTSSTGVTCGMIGVVVLTRDMRP
jgi:hypothetical protein